MVIFLKVLKKFYLIYKCYLATREIESIVSLQNSLEKNDVEVHCPHLKCVVAEKDCDFSLSGTFCTDHHSYICVKYINE
jgi:hypothetical protein